MASINVKPSGQACGAEVTGLDLSQPLDQETLAAVKEAWLEHHVLVFPVLLQQRMDLGK